MPRKTREDYRLKETKKLYEAVKSTNTHVKDYSMSHVITVIWEPANEWRRTRRVQVSIGDQMWVGYGKPILDAVNRLLEDTTKDAVMWVLKQRVPSQLGGKDMIISTLGVNKECLRDHVAEVSIGKNTAVVDLEELLKATRYA